MTEVSRRTFLAGSVALGAGAVLSRRVAGPHRAEGRCGDHAARGRRRRPPGRMTAALDLREAGWNVTCSRRGTASAGASIP